MTTACPVNIGPRGRRQRLVLGVVLAIVSAAALVLLVRAGVAPAWRLLLFVPLLGSALGVFQATAGT